jgi:hypothetical protein
VAGLWHENSMIFAFALDEVVLSNICHDLRARDDFEM